MNSNNRKKYLSNTILTPLILAILVMFAILITPVTADSINSNAEYDIDTISSSLEYAVTQKDTPEQIKADASFEKSTIYLRQVDRIDEKDITIENVLRFVENDDIKKFLSEKVNDKDNSISGYGVDYTGCLMIIVDKSFSQNEINKFIAEIDDISEQNGYSQMPLRFKTFVLNIEMGNSETLQKSYKNTLTRATQLSRWRPIIGGIQYGILTLDGMIDATIGFAATKNGQSGFVTNGHSLNTGNTIYQPASASLQNNVGVVQLIGSTYSDSSWILYNNVEAAIYSPNLPNQKRAISSYSELPGSGYINVAGINTRSYGTLTSFLSSVTVETTPPMTLYNIYTASYYSIPGDSGAPVYQQDSTTHEIRLIGVNIGGTDTGESAFSPIQGIISDLGITPLTS